MIVFVELLSDATSITVKTDLDYIDKPRQHIPPPAPFYKQAHPECKVRAVPLI